MSEVLLSRRGPVALLTLDRPTKLNALTMELGLELAARVAELRADPSLRVVLLQASGRAFSAGGDLGFLRDNMAGTAAENVRTMRRFYGLYLSLLELEVPTIALIQGRASGAGMALALGCDVRIASEDAVATFNFVKLGLSPGMGSTYLLEHLVGPARATEWLLTGRDIPMGEALAVGLVQHVVQTDRLLDAGLELAEQLLAAGPHAVRLTKQLMRPRLAGLEAALQREAEAQAVCYAGQELREGLSALMERRAPAYSERVPDWPSPAPMPPAAG